MRTASTARMTRPTKPPSSCRNCTLPTTACFIGGSEMRHFRQVGHDARHMLDRAESRAVAASEHQGRDQRGLAELRLEQFARLGRRSVPFAFFSCHTGDSGRNGRMMISGIAGITAEISA